MYRVRKTWKDSASQLGAFDILANAVALADENPSYSVFDEKGNVAYKVCFRVRKTWKDEASQLGAFTTYSNATKMVDENPGYRVYDHFGIPRYPIPYMVALTGSTTYYTDTDGGTKAGTASKGTYTITEVKGLYGRLKSGVGWLNLDGLDAYSANQTPLELVVANLEDVYNACIGCKHVSGNYDWTTAMEKKQVNCSIPVTRLAVLAGIIADGKRISHTSAIGTNATAKKNTIAKAMSGYGNLDLTKCKAVWVGKKYAKLPDEYKKAGVFYIQDSNIAVSGGDGYIYACHNWAAQMTKGKGTYATVKLDSGYTKNRDILVVIIPNG